MLAPDALNSHIDRLIDSFREELKSNTDGFIKNLDVLSLLCMDHQRTNDVRHQFKTMSVEDARVTTRHISRFMPLAGIIGVSDRTIKKYIASLQSENKIKRIIAVCMQCKLEKDIRERRYEARAMDHLNVFCKEDTSSEPIQDLTGLFE
jgi:hypothetical protein